MAYILLAATALVWGGAFVVGRLLVADVDPLTVAWFRFVVASAAFLALGRLVRPAREPAGAPRAPEATRAPGDTALARPPGPLTYALLGLTGIAGYNLFFFYGLTLATAAESSLIIASSPVVTALLGVLFLGERLIPVRAAGIGLSTAGVVVLVLGAASGAPGEGVAGTRLLGALLMLGGVVSWAVYSAIGKRVLAHVSPWAATSRAALWGTLFLTIPAALRPAETVAALGGLTPGALWGIAYLSLVCTVFGFVAWYRGVAEVGVAVSAAFLNLVPLSTLAIAFAVLGEGLSWRQGVGGLMILAGVYLVGGRARGQARGQAGHRRSGQPELETDREAEP